MGSAKTMRERCCTVEKCSVVFLALMVRSVLVLHNCLCVWRVVIVYEHTGYWTLTAANVLMLIETVLVLYHNGGMEWKWWCACFAAYLSTTIPLIWLLQLGLYNDFMAAQDSDDSSSVNQAVVMTTAPFTLTDENATTPFANVTSSIATTRDPDQIATDFMQLDTDTWVVIMMESLIYLLVFSRWLLPRSGMSREALADLLLEFLAIASDIMELLAVFEEDEVRGNLSVTYAVLAIWSLSFLQFVPVLAHGKKFRHFQSKRMRKITRACGDSFTEVLSTCISILLQDGPFLCLRLYIMLELRLITYSLMFFVLKNIVTLLLLFYRLSILCIRLPCCYKDEADILEVESVDFSKPVIIGRPHLPYRNSMNGSVNSGDMTAFPYIISAKA